MYSIINVALTQELKNNQITISKQNDKISYLESELKLSEDSNSLKSDFIKTLLDDVSSQDEAINFLEVVISSNPLYNSVN